MRANILIADDERSIGAFLSLALEDEFNVFVANSAEEAMQILSKRKIHLLLLDLILGEVNGMDVLRDVRQRYPGTAVIMMTAFGNIDTSVEAIKLGAFHYLCKPINVDELMVYVRQALEFQHLSRRVESLSTELEEMEQRTYYGDIIGKSPPMQKVYRMIDRLKDVDASVIISGESGTGKELVARAIHRNGVRKNENFVSVNCAAIPEGLLEEEFFGHVKGAFTGAVSDKKGKLEMADHGTLFLDEVGDMPISLQGKLLRALQEQETIPIGGNTYRKIDVRVVCATNRDLLQMVREKAFRSDLYYRLHVVDIRLPALRERKQDIPDLCSAILARTSKSGREPVTGLTPEAQRLLLRYDYPGNVRELVNILEYACVVCTGSIIGVDDLPDDLRIADEEASADGAPKVPDVLPAALRGLTIKEAERLMVRAALEAHPESRRAAAQQLGISERSLFYKIQEYGL